METPNGSIEDLVDRAVKHTAVARGFLYTLVRRGWADCFRVRVVYPDEEAALQKRLDKGKKAVKRGPCTVFPGIQWTSAIEIPDRTREELEAIYPEKKKYVGCGHMYRFDKALQRHVLDEIVFYRAKAFPPPLIPFTKPEPPQDSSLENRNRWELWNKKKLAHEQSESAQYTLISSKLAATDITLTACFTQLEETIMQIREMNIAVTESFSSLPLSELRELVQSIPSQIKQVAKKLHETNGIIIKDSDLKLTPAFIKSLSSPAIDTQAQAQAAVASTQLQERENAVLERERAADEQDEGRRLLKRRDSRNNRDSFVQFGGLPMETILPLIQSLKLREANGVDKKERRRLTLW